MESHNHPSLHRALPGRGDRRRRHPARRLHHGRAADRAPQRAALRRARRTRRPATCVAGVVAGIGGYGNCVGVPTVGGEITFHRAYNGNILVNAMCVGLARADRIFYARGRRRRATRWSTSAPRPAATASTAPPWPRPSSTTRREAKRPTVQVGDPFTEKLLIEACLELMADRRDRRHPGHGRRRPDLLLVRDGGARRARHRARPRPGAAARDRHDALRDHALREPGAHADGARSPAARTRRARSSRSGSWTSP